MSVDGPAPYRLYKPPLPRGLSHVLKRSMFDQLLVAGEVYSRVDAVSYIPGTLMRNDRHILVSAHWRGWWSRRLSTNIHVLAVPSHRRAELSAWLVNGGFEPIVAWLRALESRPETWLDQRQSLAVVEPTDRDVLDRAAAAPSPIEPIANFAPIGTNQTALADGDDQPQPQRHRTRIGHQPSGSGAGKVWYFECECGARGRWNKRRREAAVDADRHREHPDGPG